MGNYQRWLTTNLAGLVAALALTIALTAGLFVGIAQVRCTLLEEDLARLNSRLRDEVETFKAEQETNHKAVLGVVSDTVKSVAAHLAEAKEGEAKEEPAKEEPAADDPPKDDPEKGLE